MADDQQLALLLQNIDEWNNWRSQNPQILPNLAGANLVRADLRSANLAQADLTDADLSWAQLSGAIFVAANLQGAKLVGMDLAIAVELRMAGVNLQGAMFMDPSAQNPTPEVRPESPAVIEFTPLSTDGEILTPSRLGPLAMFSLLDDLVDNRAVDRLSTLVRYPHIESPDRTLVNLPFSIYVQLLIHPNDANALEVTIADTDGATFPEIEVVLRGANWEISGSNTQVLEIDRQADAEVRFVLIPRQVGRQSVRADLYQHGRRLGTMCRDIEIVAENPSNTTTAQAQPTAPINITSRPKNVAPDLEICISLDQPDGQSLLFTLNSQIEAVNFHHAKLGQVTLLGSPLAKMQSVYQELSQLAALDPRGLTVALPHSPEQTIEPKAERRLQAVGNQLWAELIPDSLKQQYWQFKDQVRSLLITSDEPWVPWEILKPFRYVNGQEEQDPFWCEQFAIARWLSGPGTADELPIQQVVTVAPNHSNLPAVNAEVQFLGQLHTLRSGVISSPAINDGLVLEEYLKTHPFSILHFACHGMFDDQRPNESAIMLADGPLRPSDLHLHFLPGTPRPLIFVNACDGGRVGFSFTGLGGWAEQCVNSQVGAFVGAMWEVNDTLALQFAQTFYRVLLQDNETVAEAFRQGRAAVRQAAPGNSTWLAYSLYADPEARLQGVNF